jgi:hypothetical protein
VNGAAVGAVDYAVRAESNGNAELLDAGLFVWHESIEFELVAIKYLTETRFNRLL